MNRVRVRPPDTRPGAVPHFKGSGVYGGLPSWAYAPGVISYLLYSVVAGHRWQDLGFVQLGSLLLTAPRLGGLHLYSSVPQLQMGPLTWLVGRSLWAVDPYHLQRSVWLAGVLLLVATLHFAARGAARESGMTDDLRAAIATGGVTLALGWVDMVQGWGHLDDACALALVIAAWAYAREGRAGCAGLALGAAAGFQPVVLLAAPLLLTVPSRRRAATVLVGVLVLSYAPFLLAAPRTLLRLARVRIQVQPGAVIHLLAAAGAPAPAWVRPAQLLLAATLGAAAVRRGRPDLVILTAFFSRLLLDAGDWSYYTVQVMLGLFVSELVRAAHGGRPVNWVGLRPLLVWLALSFDPFFIPLPPDLARAIVLVVAAASCLSAQPLLAPTISLAHRALLRRTVSCS